MTTALLALVLAGASLGGFAQYDRSAVLRGEVWRLVTGHFSHWSLSHLGFDLFAFVVLGAICEPRDRRLFVTVMLATTLAVSLFLAFRADVESYRGLSAIDSALWMLAVFDLGRRRPRLAVSLSALFLAKVMVESRSGALFVDGMTVLPVVHLIGAAVGLIMAAWRCLQTRSRTFSPRQRSASCPRKSKSLRAPSLCIASNAPPAPT